jgi:signal transduction histidine kinase
VDATGTTARYGPAVRAQLIERFRGASPPLLDALFALALAAATQIELWVNRNRVEGPMALQVAAFLVITLAVAWRRRAPVVAVAVVSVALAVQELLAGFAPVVGGFAAVIVTTYSVARYSSTRNAALGAGIVLASLASAYADPANRSFADAVGNLLIVGVLFVLGRVVRLWRERAGEFESRAEQAEREGAERAREAAAEERARIARELHDIVAHNVSVMVLQAGAARQVLEDAPERAREPLLAIEHTGRQAIDELRRLLGILRKDGDELTLGPQPGLADLDSLVAQMREAGLPVELVVKGMPRQLLSSLDLSAYRIAQEGLTNALKHAGRASVCVSVRWTDRSVELEIIDDGRGHGNAPGAGHGLAGMRERVAFYGGEFEAGPRAAGGYAVRATLPLASSRP